jgi:hypothetical protein
MDGTSENNRPCSTPRVQPTPLRWVFDKPSLRLQANQVAPQDTWPKRAQADRLGQSHRCRVVVISTDRNPYATETAPFLQNTEAEAKVWSVILQQKLQGENLCFL